MDGTASSNSLKLENFDAFNSSLQVSALKTTRNAQALPDIVFHRSVDPAFAAELEAFSSRVLTLTNRLLNVVSASSSTNMPYNKGKCTLENQDDVVDKFQSFVVDVVDQSLERTDICLDEYLGVTKAPAISVSAPKQMPPKVDKRARPDAVIQHAHYLAKPQLSFKNRVDNSDSPWLPSLPHKYNAKVPLGYTYRDTDADTTSSVIVSTHPYHYEITNMSYPVRMFQTCVPSLPKLLDDTPFTWVSTPSSFNNMISKLRQAFEIAIDLEHHDYRSYAGFTCLMQISTREEDWIIDALALRQEMTELNEVLTDESIVKVFHGAESDVVWLQQDFDLYLVNIFDTYHASKALNFPRHGLSNLLEMYCDFSPDKRYQLADWRIRPLPEEMIQYARCDTHYLLFIYDNLRNALLDRGLSESRSRLSSPSAPSSKGQQHTNSLLKQVLDRSKETTLKTYEKEVYDADGGTGKHGWDTLARKWNKAALLAGGPGIGIGAMQRAVYRAVHGWRDKVAREEDESTRYVLPNHYLFQLAEQPPADLAGLLRVFNNSVPPMTSKRARDLLNTIRDCISNHALIFGSSATSDSSQGNILADEVPRQQLTTGISTIIRNEISTLWPYPPSSSGSMVASTSTLFGDPVHASAPTVTFTCNTSPLFGDLASASKSENGSQFREVVARINSKLVIAPSAPKIVQPVKQLMKKDEVLGSEETMVEIHGAQVEIPFVPAARRNTTIRVDEDSIVAVGRARQRKRRRVVKSSMQRIECSSSLPIKDSSVEKSRVTIQESFDFASVPNLLDNDDCLYQEDEETFKQLKKRRKNEGFHSDFPAPPRACNEVKGGNKSYIYK